MVPVIVAVVPPRSDSPPPATPAVFSATVLFTSCTTACAPSEKTAPPRPPALAAGARLPVTVTLSSDSAPLNTRAPPPLDTLDSLPMRRPPLMDTRLPACTAMPPPNPLTPVATLSAISTFTNVPRPPRKASSPPPGASTDTLLRRCTSRSVTWVESSSTRPPPPLRRPPRTVSPRTLAVNAPSK